MNADTRAADRLARLTPQQREALLRQLARRRADAPIAPRAERDAPLPLSQAQQRIWLFEKLQPGSGAYNLYGHYRLGGALDVAALEQAIAGVVARHESLRLSFSERDGVPEQRVTDAAFELHHVDLSALDVAAREAALQQQVDACTAHVFDLSRPPLLHARLVRLGAEEHALLLVVHHIAADAWAFGLMLGEITQRYAGHGPANAALDFTDVLAWQQSAAGNDADQLAFWRTALEGCTGVLDLPTDHPRPTTASGRGARERFHLPADLAEQINEFARAERATTFMVLLAAFQVLLARHAGQDDVVVGSPVSNRRRSELEGIVGLFVNTLPMRADLSDTPGFRTLLARTRTQCLDALDHADVPLERIVDAVQPERVPGRAPLFQALFVLEPAAGEGVALQSLQCEWLEPGLQTTRFELTLALTETGSGFDGALDYDSDLFEPATMQRLARQFERLLRTALSAPEQPVATLDLLDDAQRAELLAFGDGGDAPRLNVRNLHEAIAAQALRTPQADALVSPEKTLSYAELLARVQGIARRLQSEGVQGGDCVALLADRSCEAVLAVLGVLAAGAAYVPVDPGQPDERIDFMLRDTQSRVLLVPPAQAERARAFASTYRVIEVAGIKASTDALPCEAGPDDIAYVIYTSGSTGQPKGVVVEHRGALNLVEGFLARHDFERARLLMIPPLVFDASVGDLFPALACGGTLVLHPDPAKLGAVELRDFCLQHAINAIDAPAALWRRWTEGWMALGLHDPLPALRLMMIGGESLPLAAVRDFARLTGARVALCNHYGPTEASVCAAMLSTVDGTGLIGPDLPVGRPLPGVRLHVVDANGALAPRGVAGELLIGGQGVARGYLNQPELTGERFVADRFAGGNARLYRTGDLARWDASGQLCFLGRRDHQVKLRGIRIELGEIESALQSHLQVETAVAVLREDRPGDRRLVAYVTTRGGIETGALDAHLAARLPDAMLPSALVVLDAMPLNRNGKVDRKALPAPAYDTRERVPTVPRTETERRVLAVWSDVLGRDDLGVDDDFFASGGDSLSTLPLAFRLNAALDVQLPLSTVFATPTVAGLAREIERLRAGQGDDAVDLTARVVLDNEIHAGNTTLPAAPRATPRCALVTGATGFLGAYLVRELLDVTSADVVCLVRARDQAEGLARVRANLQRYGLWNDADAPRLRPLPGDLASPRLGLDEAAFAALAAEVDVIFHNGGMVNFLAPYEHLDPPNVGGTREVLRLATHTRLKPVHLVSTLGVYVVESLLGRNVAETDPPPPGDEQAGGYNQSKWVGEQLGLLARTRGVPVAVYRPARVTGDARTGAGNVDDFFCAWIRGCVRLGKVPALADLSFDMAPVDYIGRGIVRLALGAGEANGNFHFINPKISVRDVADTLREHGYPIEEVPYADWRAALLADVAQSRDNPLAAFAGLFAETLDLREPQFDCSGTRAALEAHGLTCPPADRALFSTYVRFLQAQGALVAAETLTS